MSAREAERIAARQQLLELEAEVQRATLCATFATWEEKRTLAWATAAGGVALRLLAVPRVRLLLVAALLAKLRPKSRR